MTRNRMIFTVLVVAVVASIGGNFYLYQQYDEANTLLTNPGEAAKQEVAEYTAKVSKLMDLPTDEEPTIATILDKEALADQPFFARAENGDKVLIYSKATKAILYRPSTDRIIEVAPIEITDEDPALETNPDLEVVEEETVVDDTEETTEEETTTEEE